MALLRHVSELLEESGEYVDARALAPACTQGALRQLAASCEVVVATPPLSPQGPPGGYARVGT
jgi:hypothetical protein